MNSLLIPRIVCWVFAAAMTLAAVTLPSFGDEPNAGDEFFEREVRPLLAEKCFSCHGRGQKKGMLSLDSRAAVMAGGESGTAVVAGKPDKSLLVAAINYTGDVQMPPDAKLSEREIAVLKKWVALDVPWPSKDAAADSSLRNDGTITEQDRQFWSFRPVREPPLPSVRRENWIRKPLDSFILHRLESEGLEPVGEADRPTFIRRATFDLLGLPPSEEEVATFVADDRPEAFERLVERLLDRPQYGERWARHWLDIARYGEDQAHTFQARVYPNGYRYRDWVVAALNRDLPIDQFLLEQIAGDLLPGEDRIQRLPALGYFALGPVYYADAGCAPKAKADEYDDRIDTLCRGVLGLTVSCARCHDHKFDPITTKDYYALAGIFASTEYAETPLAPLDVVKVYDKAQAEIKQSEQRLKEAETDASRQLGESLAPQAGSYLLAAWRVQNRRKVEAAYKVSAVVEGTELRDFIVERWLLYLASDEGKRIPVLASWREALAGQDAKQDLSDDAVAIEAVQKVCTEIQSKLLAAVEIRREAEAKYRAELSALAADVKPPNKPNFTGEVGSLLKNFIDDNNAPLSVPKDRLEKLLSEETRQAVAALKKTIDEQKKNSPPKYPVAHSLVEGKPTNTKIQIRGNVKELGEEAPRRFLAVLSPAEPPPFMQGSGRLELAQAIVNPENPLTARVFVNRVWQHHFGRGIVGTPSNFGLLGERPTHAELLDYLAARFVASGWSLKQLHRDLMLSATYRLASQGNVANQEHDPDNRLLWRMNRRRLDIEAWRDAMLVVAGNLDPAFGGPSVNLSAGNNHRRTLYGAVSRHELNPTLRLFDFPDANLTSERRVVTTVPMQQLFMLNSDFMAAQSRTLIARLQPEKLTDDDAKVERLYRWVFGRVPRERERQLGREFLSRSLPEGVSANEVKLTRWEQLAQALLSTNEFLFVD